MDAPESGSHIKKKTYKHIGQLHRTWENNIVLKGTQTVVIGANDKAFVTESNGRTWITREPAISYVHSAYWFNVIGMLRQDGIYYYCNMSSPFARSEEHTSELQSRFDLVCRLLLEK